MLKTSSIPPNHRSLTSYTPTDVLWTNFTQMFKTLNQILDAKITKMLAQVERNANKMMQKTFTVFGFGVKSRTEINHCDFRRKFSFYNSEIT